MNFPTIDAFLVFLASRPAAIKAGEHRGLEAAGKMLEHAAKAMIGSEIREWADLAPSTVEEKQRLGYTGQVSATDPLLRTGELRNSIRHVVGEHKVTLGSDDPVAEWQEYGTVRIPPRPFIGATMHRDAHEAAELIANHMMGAVVGRQGPLRPVPRRDGDES